MRKKVLLFWFAAVLLFSVENAFASFGSKSKEKEPAAVESKPSNSELRDGLKEFNSLSKAEKKSRFKEMKKAIKEFKAQKKAGASVDTNTLLLVVLSLFIPPLAVYLHEGATNNRFWISVLLTILGYLLFGFAGIFFLGSLPGIIYALIVVLADV